MGVTHSFPTALGGRHSARGGHVGHGGVRTWGKGQGSVAAPICGHL